MRAEMLELFDIDPDVVHLNPGAFGMVPRTVRAAQRRWWDRIEANPVRFFREEVDALGDHVRADVCAHLGTSDGSTALVRNVSEAFGVVVRAVGIGQGDEVVVSNHGYPTVAMAVERAGATVRVVDLPLDPGPEEVADAFAGAVTERTTLVCVDAVTSVSGQVLPVAEVIRAVSPVPVYVDAAHCAGHLEVDVEALGAAFWATNLHKWSFTPRGTGALWVAPPWRERAHPAVTSWTHALGFPAAHDFPGTVDFSAQLAIPDGLRFWREQGGFAIADRLRDQLQRGSAIVWNALTDAFDDQPPFDENWPRNPAPGMRIVPLPAERGPRTFDDVRDLYRTLSDRGIECPPAVFEGRGILRLGAQIVNDDSDYERLADALVDVVARPVR